MFPSYQALSPVEILMTRSAVTWCPVEKLDTRFSDCVCHMFSSMFLDTTCQLCISTTLFINPIWRHVGGCVEVWRHVGGWVEVWRHVGGWVEVWRHVGGWVESGGMSAGGSKSGGMSAGGSKSGGMSAGGSKSGGMSAGGSKPEHTYTHARTHAHILGSAAKQKGLSNVQCYRR